MAHAYLFKSFKDCLVHAKLTALRPQLRLWLLMVGGTTLCTATDNTWLQPLLEADMEAAGISSWPQMQATLNSFLWINLLHDKAAKSLYDTLTSTSRDVFR